MSSDLKTWSAHRARAVGRAAGRAAPAVLTAVFIGAISVGLGVLLDGKSSDYGMHWYPLHSELEPIQRTPIQDILDQYQGVSSDHNSIRHFSIPYNVWTPRAEITSPVLATDPPRVWLPDTLTLQGPDQAGLTTWTMAIPGPASSAYEPLHTTVRQPNTRAAQGVIGHIPLHTLDQLPLAPTLGTPAIPAN